MIIKSLGEGAPCADILVLLKQTVRPPYKRGESVLKVCLAHYFYAGYIKRLDRLCPLCQDQVCQFKKAFIKKN